MFNKNNFCHIASNNRNEKKAGVFVYKTTDSLETVATSGYFNDKIVDINLHDLIIHEWHNPADRTDVQHNLLCVVERTLDNVGTIVIKSKWEGDIEQIIEGLGNNFVKIDGSSIMTGPLKFRAGSMRGAIAPYLNGVSFWKMDSQGNITNIANLTDSQFLPVTTNSIDLGNTTHTWKDAYVARVITSVLNNGADINVPTTGGTLGLNDFSNITDSAKNISNWSSNVSNCITEIPQDIQLELSSGTLILKEGSKAYRPNGAGVFTQLTNAADRTLTYTTNGTYMVFSFSFNSITLFPVGSVFSGATAPSVSGSAVWYDTTNNVIKATYDSGSTWEGTILLPLGVVTVSSGAISSIDQVFNGIGYIGSTIYMLPGVKGLIPNGRNADGTLNNLIMNCTSVKTKTVTTSFSATISIGSGAGLDTYSVQYYNPETNYNYNSTGNLQRLSAGTVKFGSGGVVQSFNPKTTFHAVDYSDTEYIAHQAMPSNESISVTVSTSSTTYTAPCDGWFYAVAVPTAIGQFLRLQNLENSMESIVHSGASGIGVANYLPIKQGDRVRITYNTGNAPTAAFVKVVGSSK